VLLGAATAMPDDARRVRFVDHEVGTVSACGSSQLRQRRDVAVHAEDAVTHHQLAATFGRRTGSRQDALEGTAIAVRKALLVIGAARPATVMNAGVTRCVAHDHVAISHKRGNGAQVGRITTGEDDCVLTTVKATNGLLELTHVAVGSAQERRARRAVAIVVERSLHRLDHARMTVKVQVAVRVEADQLALVAGSATHADPSVETAGEHGPVKTWTKPPLVGAARLVEATALLEQVGGVDVL